MAMLLNLILIIVLFGVFLWLINAYVPMPGLIKSLLNLLIIIVVIIYILQFFGIITPWLPLVGFIH